jgi:hypothetical protein
MLHACVQRFDVTENLKILAKILASKRCPNIFQLGLFRSQIFPQIPLCKKKILHHIKMPAHIWSTKCRWNKKLIAQFCYSNSGTVYARIQARIQASKHGHPPIVWADSRVFLGGSGRPSLCPSCPRIGWPQTLSVRVPLLLYEFLHKFGGFGGLSFMLLFSFFIKQKLV